MQEQEQKPCALRVVEFYSGIGGMHFALEESGLSHEVVACLEINDVANAVYRHNFPGTPIMQRNIESLSVGEISKLNADVFLMSPPCQPFTRVGLKGDVSDARTGSFLHILDLIEKLDRKPGLLLVENVKGFDTSHTRERLIETLENSSYKYQEFLLNPPQFGIPNSRLRYYLVAIHSASSYTFSFKVSKQILTDFSVETVPVEGREIETYLEKSQSDDYFEAFLLHPSVLNRFGMILDIVTSKSRRSCCFTKAYSHYVEGTGSVLQMAESVSMDSVYSKFKAEAGCGDSEKSVLSSLKLRFFSPREVANLLSFPPRFRFPDSISSRQKYRLLGNSLNVHVVMKLLLLCCSKNAFHT
eukprot:m.89599 g.89599  ORF g.89599 m.89599 type:complete len:357 (+) comp36611_c0_seq5:49-1119(+)